MPRDTIDVTRFNAGIISSADPSDLPPDSAAFDQDIDPDVTLGELRSRGEDWNAFDGDGTSAAHYWLSGAKWIERSDGTKTIVAHQDTGSVGYFRYLKNWPTPASPWGTDTDDACDIGTGKTTSIEPFGESCYCGYGNNSTTTPKWVGYIPYGQFGATAAPDTCRGLEAACAPPSYVPMLYKTVSDGTHVYGIEWKGQYIYKIAISDGTVTRSTTPFTSLQGLCVLDSSHLIVLDYISRPGMLLQVNMSDLGVDDQVVLTYQIAKDPWRNENGTYSIDVEPSDLIVTKNSGSSNLWIAWYNPDNIKVIYNDTDQKYFLYRVPLASLWSSSEFSGYYALGLPLHGYTGDHAAAHIGAFDTSIDLTYKLKKTPFLKRTLPATVPAIGEVIYHVDIIGTVWGVSAGDKAIPGDCVIFIRDDFTSNDVYKDMLGGWYFDDPNSSYNGHFVAAKLAGTDKYNSLVALQTTPAQTADEDPYMIVGLTSGATHSAWVIGAHASNGQDTDAWTNYHDGTGSNDHYTWGEDNAVVPVTIATTTTYTVDKFDNILVAGACNAGVSTYYRMAVFEANTTSADWRPRFICVRFSSGSPPTWYDTQYIKSSPLIIRLTTSATEKSSFSGSKKYWYRVSLIYDGMQESPLNIDTYVPYIALGYNGAGRAINVNISFYDISAWLNPRVSQVYIYRAEADTTETVPTTFYRYCGSLDTTIPWSTYTGTAGWTATDSYTSTFVDRGIYGPSFESNSGLPEAYNDSNVCYQLSTQYGGYLYVGKAYHPLWEDSSHVIFRSQQNCFSSFNVLENYVVLPTIPVAMSAYKGYIYVWDAQNTYKLNAATMAMEEVLAGIGCSSHKSVCSTEYGLFWGDANTIYKTDGSTIERVGDAISARSTGVGTSHAELMSSSYGLSIMPFLAKNMICFLYTKSGQVPRAFMYHLKTQSWHYWLFDGPSHDGVVNGSTYATTLTGCKGGFSDYRGRLYLSAMASGGGQRDGLVLVTGATSTYRDAYWYTQEFPLDDHSQKKRYYGCYIIQTNSGGGGVTATYSVDGGSYTTLTFGTLFRRMRICLLLNDHTTSNILHGFSIIYRKLIGKR